MYPLCSSPFFLGEITFTEFQALVSYPSLLHFYIFLPQESVLKSRIEDKPHYIWLEEGTDFEKAQKLLSLNIQLVFDKNFSMDRGGAHETLYLSEEQREERQAIFFINVCTEKLYIVQETVKANTHTHRDSQTALNVPTCVCWCVYVWVGWYKERESYVCYVYIYIWIDR